MYCKNCGNEVSADALFCKNCGATIKKKSEPVAEEPVLAVETVLESTNTTASSKKSSKKWIAIGCGAIAVALIVVGALWIGLGTDDKIVQNDKTTGQTENADESSEFPSNDNENDIPQEPEAETDQNDESDIDEDNQDTDPENTTLNSEEAPSEESASDQNDESTDQDVDYALFIGEWAEETLYSSGGLYIEFFLLEGDLGYSLMLNVYHFSTADDNAKVFYLFLFSKYGRISSSPILRA